jgi:hypothetical protein
MGGKDVDAKADDGRVASPPTASRTPQTGPDTTKE